MVLVVELRILTEREDGVEIERLSALFEHLRADQAYQQAAAMHLGLLRQRPQQRDVVVGEVGDRGLWPHDQRHTERSEGEVTIAGDSDLEVRRDPLLVLRDGALDHRHLYRRAG